MDNKTNHNLVVNQIFPENALYFNKLDLDKFVHCFDNRVTCYKFYWLESILNLLAENPERSDFSFDEISEEMIANAWYSIREYHLHMGTQFTKVRRINAIEKAVNHIADETGVENDASKKEILYKFQEYKNNKQFIADKKSLMEEVPFHFLAPFYPKKEMPKALRLLKTKECISAFNTINEKTVLPYSFVGLDGLSVRIKIQEDWKELLIDNIMPLKGWIQFQKIQYLQNLNPEVPGIIYKLDPRKSRKRELKNARNLWDSVIIRKPVIDIYSGRLIDTNKYDLDHFIPWSYITNDELWNLIPADKSANTSKNNNLPAWDKYFGNFAEEQYGLYSMIFSDNKIYELFAKCWKDNLKSYWGGQELYTPNKNKEVFVNTLERHMKQHYDSAKRQGYCIWTLT